MSPKNTRTDGHTKYESGTLSKETYLESCRMRVSDGENNQWKMGEEIKLKRAPPSWICCKRLTKWWKVKKYKATDDQKSSDKTDLEDLLKGILYCLLLKSHILDSNVVWYSSFWSEGPKNHRNLKILVLNFVPRGFEARRTWGFEAQHHGVSRGGAGVSRHSTMGFRGAAPWGFEGQQHW